MPPAKKSSGRPTEREPQVPGPHFARRMAARIYVAAFVAALGSGGWLTGKPQSEKAL
jgi:hypothetical protein